MYYFKGVNSRSLPISSSEDWKKGFEWNGVQITVIHKTRCKTLIDCLKSMKYCFFEIEDLISQHDPDQEDSIYDRMILPLVSVQECSSYMLITTPLMTSLELEKST